MSAPYTVHHYDSPGSEYDTLREALEAADLLGVGYYVHASDIDHNGSTIRTWEDLDERDQI